MAGAFFTNIDGDDTYLIADAIVREEPVARTVATKQTVDTAATISNHIQVLPDGLKVRALWTDSPLASNPASNDGVLASIPSDQQALRPGAAYEWFKERRGRGTFTYESLRWGFIPNLVLENMTTVVTNKGSLQLELTFAQITYAQSEEVDLPPRRIIPKTAKTEGDKGDQAGKILDPDVGFASVLDGAFTLFTATTRP